MPSNVVHPFKLERFAIDNPTGTEPIYYKTLPLPTSSIKKNKGSFNRLILRRRSANFTTFFLIFLKVPR